MSGDLSFSTRQYAAMNGPNATAPYMPSQQQDHSQTDPLRAFGHEPSSLRGRAPTMGSSSNPPLAPQQTGPASTQSSTTPNRTGLERKPSGTAAHYRQASKTHGNNSQSRNALLVSSTQNGSGNPDVEPLPEGSSFSDYNTMIRRGASRRRPSASPSTTLNGSVSTTSSATLLPDRDNGDSNNTLPTARRLDRSQSSKNRKERSHHRSRSRNQMPLEQKTVGEYALHHLFNKFNSQTDYKIKQCVMDPALPVERICGAGADPDFDQLISALAHITRRKPKPLVDTIMLWRMQKREGPQAVGEATSPTAMQRNRSQSGDHGATIPPHDEPAHVIEHRSAVATYLTCRVLIVIFTQSDASAITPALFDKLEGIVFSQLERMDPLSFDTYPYREANFRIVGQLLGVMSSLNLPSVARCFVNALKAFQKELNVKGVVPRDLESRTALTIEATQHMHIRTQPENSWRESCEFIYAIGEIFINSHGPLIKHTYCQTLEHLVIPVVAYWNPQVNTVRWKDFLNHVNNRLSQMLIKPRHWQEAFRLSIIILCASPTEHFGSLWLSTATSLQAKLKDRVTRATALEAICRLTWTYLNRVVESSQATLRKLDDVVKAVLPSGKKSYLTVDAAFSGPIVELIRVIGYRYPEFCFRTIIFPLMNADHLLSAKELKVEQFEPERMIVGIKAFLLIMSDLELGDGGRPPFPRFNSGGLAIDPNTVAEIMHGSRRHGTNLKSRGGFLVESTSRPVVVARLTDQARDIFARFCEVLGKIITACDAAFGVQAVLDEKLGGLTPKTPITDAFSFGRKEDHAALADQRLGFYELLHVAIQVVPRCIASDLLPLKRLINLLCTATAHVQSNISVSATASLKSIAQHGHAQAITTAFANFIFNFDIRYATMSDEGMLGPGHIENTLRLYIELLQIWIGEIKQKKKDAAIEASGDGSRGLQLALTSLSPYVEEVEAHGVFFLCSQSRIVRSYAVKVLRVVTELDAALGKQSTRIINLLEEDAQLVMDINDDYLSVAERSRLEKSKRKGPPQHTLIELCSSDVSYDSTLWLKVFPNIIRLSLDVSPLAVEIGREIVCNRLVQMHESISRLDAEGRMPPVPGGDPNALRHPNRYGSASPDVTVEQWKLYLIMACATMKEAGAQTQSQLDNMQHARKASKGAQQNQDRISSARALVAFVIPLLSASQSSIREAIVTALGSIHVKLYRTLLDSLQYAVTTCKEEAKQRIVTHQRTGSNPQKDRRTDRLRTEVTQVYRLTARFLHEEVVLRDEWILNNLCTYAKELMIFLGDADVQADWECQKLRRQYCGFLEEVYHGVNRTGDPSRFLPFEIRKSAFILIEEWCGFSPNQGRAQQREEYMKQAALERYRDPAERSQVTSKMEIERKELGNAALSAMASLCAGPVIIKANNGLTMAFDSRRMLSWINHIFQDPSDKLHTIGRRALTNLITCNRDAPFLMEYVVEQCYVSDQPRMLESYFEVVSKILTDYSDYPLPFWRILGAMLFTLGDDNSEIRTKSAKLLQRLEQRRQQNSGIQDFDISISDRTKAVYKQAQFEMSQNLSENYADLAVFVFSQFSSHFRSLNGKPESQRNMVATILPWIRVIELQVEAKGGPTAQSYMVLANLLEITTKASAVLHNEIQALWQALAARHAGNVQLVLDFIITLCLERRDQTLVSLTKQIVVYLSKTQAGQKVVEFLLLQVTPKNMVQKPRDPIVVPPDNLSLPYVADFAEALPQVREQNGFSLGHLALIFLVDLMVGKIKFVHEGTDPSRQDLEADCVKLRPESVALLLQEIFVLWDSNVPIVQEQAREMLVHLIHGLVITGTEDGATNPTRSTIEDFIESVRRKDQSTLWQYRERDGRGENWSFYDSNDALRVPESMPIVAIQVVRLFKLKHPAIQDDMARVALQWGTSCPVRHIACRSLQIFRCILVPLDRPMLIDVLARISNTVVHEEEDVQLFAIEMLTTLKTIIGALEPAEILQWPHLFWTACACLDTIYEREFVATLAMIEKLLSQINLSDPAVVKILEKAKPSRWHGAFEGITPFVYKGLKSEMALEKSLKLLDSLVALPPSTLVGDSTRLLFVTLAYLPYFLHSFDDQSKLEECVQCAQNLASVADNQGEHQLAMVFNTFASKRYPLGKEFLTQILATLRRAFFPALELNSLIFVIGLLTNRSDWYKVKTLDVLQLLIHDVDTRRPDIANQGPDLISPLLRLLQTQYCSQAIDVLDQIMYMSETPMTRHHMRMSMAGLGSRSIPVRKEYEKTQSLYGIPEETGWSVPMPAIHSNTTRANMQVIHHDCAHPSAPEAEAAPTPEIEFHPEEEHPGSYFSLERSDTLQNDETMPENNAEGGGMGDIVTKLNSLNDFFDDTLDDEESSRYSTLTIMPYSQDIDNSADFYDQETAPILQQTLARTASISSIQGSSSERRDPGVMNPTAFNPSSSSLAAPSRPTLHSRSVTSPANNLNRLARNNTDLLSDDEAEETFSEDERVTGHAGGNNSRLQSSTSFRGTSSKTAPGMEGRDYRQKGLLRAQSQSRSHGNSPASPEVPKVPDAYLKMNDRPNAY